MAKRVLGLVSIGLLVVGLAACRPAFPAESTLATAMDGGVVVLGWDEPSVPNPEQPLEEFRILVDGVIVSTIPGYLRGCRLLGLEDATSYSIGVVAIDAKGRGSEPLTASVTTSFTTDSGDEIFCSTAPPDLPE